jgi:hypothetical protein
LKQIKNKLYSIAVGLSMCTTAMVARRVGENDLNGAAAGVQAIYFFISPETNAEDTGVTLIKSPGGLIFYSSEQQVTKLDPEK